METEVPIKRKKSKEQSTSYNENEEIYCPECLKETEIFPDMKRGEYICRNCGLVCGKIMVTTAKNPNIFNASSNQKIGANPIISIFGAKGSHIDRPKTKFFKDIYNKRINGKDQKKFYRLKTYYNKTLPYWNKKTHQTNVRIITDIVSHLELNKNIKYSALYFYRMVIYYYTQKLIQVGRKWHYIGAICLLLATRKYNVPISINDLINEYKKRQIKIKKKGIRKLLHQIKTINKDIIVTTNSEDYVLQIVTKIITSDKVNYKLKNRKIDIRTYETILTKTAHDLLSLLPKATMYGKNTFNISMAAVWSAEWILYRVLQQRELSRILIGKNSLEVSLRYYWKRYFKYNLIAKIIANIRFLAEMNKFNEEASESFKN
ncbi:MAG: hypothetical protein EAX96_06600 [Candidatus Lokiarchaeota archaeon]|nr:hypothetical protein [Candidatus Lokiarchaeota archaeon]